MQKTRNPDVAVTGQKTWRNIAMSTFYNINLIRGR